MGLFSFIKDAGSNLFGNDAEAAEDRAGMIRGKLAEFGIDGVSVAVDDAAVTLAGEVENKIVKRKAIIIAGNVSGVASVDDQMTYAMAEMNEGETSEAPTATEEDLSQEFYTVQSGDSLSGIAKEVYGDAMKYPVIFEANKPMLSDPDKIYPGQMLIIPSLEE